MYDFQNIILKAISNYKLILRKTLPAATCTLKLHELGIKRQAVKEANEIGLYRMGLKIIDDLKHRTDINKDKKTTNFYHGASEFLQYLENIYSEYIIEGDRVIHFGQKASCSLVTAIQLLTMSKGKLTKGSVQQIIEYGKAIDMYGSKEQKEVFINAVHEYQPYLVSELPNKMFEKYNISL